MVEQMNKMSIDNVKAGTRFYMENEFGKLQYYFGWEHGKALVLRRKGGQYIGEITSFNDEGFEVSVWILKKQASVFVRYEEVTYVKPKNDFE